MHEADEPAGRAGGIGWKAVSVGSARPERRLAAYAQALGSPLGTAMAQSPLYRYMSLAHSDRREWARQSISDAVIYFAAPTSFNDPSEFRFRFTIRDSLDAWEALRAQPAAKDRFGDQSAQELRDFFQVTARELPDVVRNAIVRETTLCCFAATGTDPLLWSHYADGHRGICLKFSAGPNSILGLAEKVVYSAEPPLFVLPDSLMDDDTIQSEVGRQIVFTKSHRWGYENEWRIVQLDTPPGVRRLRANELTAVILGCRITERDAALTSGWLHGARSEALLYRAMPRADTYDLELLST